jgi:hypothetical protein
MDQAGTEKAAEGEAVDFGEQMSMAWFVKGVDGNPEGN